MPSRKAERINPFPTMHDVITTVVGHGFIHADMRTVEDAGPYNHSAKYRDIFVGANCVRPREGAASALTTTPWVRCKVSQRDVEDVVPYTEPM